MCLVVAGISCVLGAYKIEFLPRVIRSMIGSPAMPRGCSSDFDGADMMGGQPLYDTFAGRIRRRLCHSERPSSTQGHGARRQQVTPQLEFQPQDGILTPGF